MKTANWKKRAITTLTAGTLLGGAFYAGMAFAAVDPLLNSADLSAEKAIAQLQSAQNAGVQPAFGGHRAKAIKHLKQARREIKKASKYAEKHQPPAPPPPPATP